MIAFSTTCDLIRVGAVA